jgi:hypothetical protein
MNRPLLKDLTGNFIAKQAGMKGTGNSEELIKLTKEMKSYLQEAAADLLQPRPEAIAQLLKKSLVK